MQSFFLICKTVISNDSTDTRAFLVALDNDDSLGKDCILSSRKVTK